MDILYLIPARGGSKGLPGKNIKKLNGKPLIEYTLDAALAVSDKANICVSTDSSEIIDVVQQTGIEVPFIRPAELALDITTTEEVIKHAIAFYTNIGKNYDYIVLLQPTSPLRTGEQLSEALKLIQPDTEIIVSVKETDANPYYVLFEEDAKGILKKSKEGNFTRRQDCPIVYQLNGAIYIISKNYLELKGIANLAKTKFLMDKRSSIDIDDQFDFALAELILSGKLS